MINLVTHVYPNNDPCRATVRAVKWDGEVYCGLVGRAAMHYDDCAGYVYELQTTRDAPLFAAARTILVAAQWLKSKGVNGVMIHTEGKNMKRGFYRRLGFVPVPKVQGLMATDIDEALAALNRFGDHNE